MKLDQLSVCLRKCDDLLKGKDQIKLAEVNSVNGSLHVFVKPREGVVIRKESQGTRAESEGVGSGAEEDAEMVKELETNEEIGLDEAVVQGCENKPKGDGETGEASASAGNAEREDVKAETVESKGRVKRSAAQLASVRLIAALPDRERPKAGFRPTSDLQGKRLSVSSSSSSALTDCLPVSAKKSRASTPSSTETPPEDEASENPAGISNVEVPGKTEALEFVSNSTAPKKRGRPKGSKNKPKVKVESVNSAGGEKSEREAPALRVESWLRQSQSNFGGIIAVKSMPVPTPPVRFSPPGFAVPVQPSRVDSNLPVARRSRPWASPNQQNPGTLTPVEAQESVQYYPEAKNGDSGYAFPDNYAFSYPEDAYVVPKQEFLPVQLEEHSVLNWHWSWNHHNGLPPGYDSPRETNRAEEWLVWDKSKVDDWPVVFAAPEPVFEPSERVVEVPAAVKPKLEQPREKFFGVTRVVNPIRVSDTEVNCSWCSKVVKKPSFRAHVMTWHRKVGIYRCGMCNEGFRLQGEAQAHLKTHENGGTSTVHNEETSNSFCEDSYMASMDDSCSNLPMLNDESATPFWNCDESSCSNLPDQAAFETGTGAPCGVVDDLVEFVGDVTNSSTFSDEGGRAVDVSDAWIQSVSQQGDPILGLAELLLLEDEGVITPVAMFPVVRQVSSMPNGDLDVDSDAFVDVDDNQESEGVKEYLIIDDSSVNLFTRQCADIACVF